MAQLSKRTHWTLVFSLEDSGCKYMFQFLCALLYTHTTPSLYTHAFTLYARIPLYPRHALSIRTHSLSICTPSFCRTPLSKCTPSFYCTPPRPLYARPLYATHPLYTPSIQYTVPRLLYMPCHTPVFPFIPRFFHSRTTLDMRSNTPIIIIVTSTRARTEFLIAFL